MPAPAGTEASLRERVGKAVEDGIQAEAALVAKRTRVRVIGELDVRGELFCQAMASGKGNKEAAVSAGYGEAGAGNQAYRLLMRDEIQRRIGQLTKSKQDAAIYSLADGLTEAEIARQLALKKENPAALVQATRLKADLAGLLIQKIQSEVTTKGSEEGLKALALAVKAAMEDPRVACLLAEDSGPAVPRQGAASASPEVARKEESLSGTGGPL